MAMNICMKSCIFKIILSDMPQFPMPLWWMNLWRRGGKDGGTECVHCLGRGWTMSMSETWTTSRGHYLVPGLYMLMSVTHASIGCHVCVGDSATVRGRADDYGGLSCHLRSWEYLWSVLPAKALWMPVVCAASVHGPCCLQLPCGCPLSVLFLTIKDKEVPSAVVSMFIDSWGRET